MEDVTRSRSTTKDALFSLFQKLRSELDYISLQSLVHKQSQVLDSCELIGQKQYYTCVDKKDIISGGKVFLSISYHSVHVPLNFI